MTVLRLPLVLAAAMAAFCSPARALPALGDTLPKLTAYDADGMAFDLAERLKGHHAVIVFGCLT